MTLAGSFRDPSGYVFSDGGVIYRFVAQSYARDYDALMGSGLYDSLSGDGLLIDHREQSEEELARSGAYRILRPRQIPFISHPFEWSFSQLKDAALLTLEIQRRAVEHKMVLKDASAYNVQFYKGKPLFIDTLSFERWIEGAPWVAYRQFCQHFLAPLALMSFADVRLGDLLRVHLDGIPLDLAVRLLPFRARLRMSLWPHLFLHARVQKSYAGRPDAVREGAKRRRMSRMGMLGLIDSLRGAVNGLDWSPRGTEWGDYYDQTNYTDASLEAKRRLVDAMIDAAQPREVWDFGANTGAFSRLASEKGILTVAFDIDPAAVEKNYRQVSAQNEENLLPLILDLTNPSPALGWEHSERASLAERGEVDLVLALALVHHLAIGNNLPLPRVAAFFARIGRKLIVEFVPKSDSQVQRLLAAREDIFPDYDEAGFERGFAESFTLREKASIPGTERTLYLMERR